MAASAPENGPLSPRLPTLEIVEAPSGETTLAGWCPIELCRSAAAPANNGDPGELPVCAIMGEAEPTELRFESISFRLCTRRMMKKARIHVVAIARNPSTTMTAIAQ